MNKNFLDDVAIIKNYAKTGTDKYKAVNALNRIAYMAKNEGSECYVSAFEQLYPLVYPDKR